MMPLSKPRLLSAAQAAAFNTFRVGKSSSSTRKRGKFDPKRRQEVKAVRQKRACLRCSLLHVSCSDHDICTACRQLALILHVHEKQTMSFSGCIRTMPSEVSIFETYLNAHESQEALVAKSQKLAMTTISLEFSSLITWDLRMLVEDVAKWLNDPKHSETSKVGTLSSPQFLDLVKPYIEVDATTDFHRMIYAISLAYTQPTAPHRHHLSILELHQIGSVAGHKFLKRLDKRLKPQHLKTCSGNELRSLFLLVIGTILAVGYTDPSIFGSASENNSGFKDMQSFLCQILAHYLVFLGSQLKLGIAGGADAFILQAAPTRWNKQGLFQWGAALDVESELASEQSPEQASNFLVWEDISRILQQQHSECLVLADCCHSGNISTTRDVRSGQCFDGSAFYQPPQAPDLVDSFELPFKNPTCLIFNPVAVPSPRFPPEKKLAGPICWSPSLSDIEVFRESSGPLDLALMAEFSPGKAGDISHGLVNEDNILHPYDRSKAIDRRVATAALSFPCSGYESGLPEYLETSELARSDQPLMPWQPRFYKDGESWLDLSYDKVNNSLNPNSSLSAKVESPTSSITTFTLREEGQKIYRPKRHDQYLERRLEAAKSRKLGACVRCRRQSIRCSSPDVSKICRFCSITKDLLCYEKQTLGYIGIQTLIPEGSPFPSCEFCVHPEIGARIEKRRLLV